MDWIVPRKKEEILKYFSDINYAYNDCTRLDSLKKALSELEEVVHCRDCEVLITRTQGGKSVYYCPFINHYTCETFFCAKGERKDV